MKRPIYYKTANAKPAVKYLTEQISYGLSRGPVLWLLSGGSYIPIQIGVAKKLAGRDLSGLSVSLTDERFGPDGHEDSNWQKLLDGGFDVPGANLYPILQGKEFGATVDGFEQFLASQLDSGAYKLACVGIGADGHTLGVLIGSPAVNAGGTVIGYQGSDFKRITMTLGALKRLDEVVVYMTGGNKHKLIKQLLEEDLPVGKQPAQAIKQAKKVIVYNDYIGEPQ